LDCAAWLPLAAFAAMLLLPAGADAQQSSGPQQVVPPAPPSQTKPDTPGGAARSGVIRPPREVDPGITKPPPANGANTMPVIPPPGSPGGNPRIKPQ
jgi:hypothetical protein